MYISYIDPGTGSMVISAIIAMISVAFFALKDGVYRLFSKKGDKGEKFDSKKHYPLVFYSEGRQYYNVFYPLLIEVSKLNIDAIYLTSDKEDPALNNDIEGIQSIFIGTGKEAYFHLNRLNADMVIMTTPGLDVLEIKRSKNVKHYSHITHATSSSGSYKAYATDYYDSVLVGGEGEVELIRELEEKRGLAKKEIEIIGHTYLDVLREKLKNSDYKYNLFKERKTTILLSPTWGNHGLLSKYGDKLLSVLEKSNKYNVIVRPHPQSFISDKEIIEDLMKQFPNNENRVWDRERENLIAMSHADIMISDFSGIIFDFYTLFKKPILTLNFQYDKRGREAMDLSDDPWDIKLLDKIGRSLDESDIDNIVEVVDETLLNSSVNLNISKINTVMDKYPNESAKRGIEFIKQTLIKIYVREPYSQRNRFLSINNLFNTVLSSLYLTVLSFILKVSLLDGKSSQLFFSALFKYALYFTFILVTVFIVLLLIFKQEEFIIEIKKYKLKWHNFLLVILPMTPIVQYVINNEDILEVFDSISIIVLFTLISFCAVIVIPYLLNRFIPFAYTTSISTAIVFIFFNMANFGEKFRMVYIGLIMAVLIVFIYLMIILDKVKVLNVIISIFMVSTIISSHLSVDSLWAQDHTKYLDTKIAEYIGSREPVRKPNIYLLVYDAYSNEETWSKLGFDNSKQIDYLLDKGFAIYDGTYSIGYASLVSISHMFNLNKTPYNLSTYRKILGKDAPGINLLKDNNYTLKFISNEDYMLRKVDSIFDETFPSKQNQVSSSKIIIRSILNGEFDASVNFSHVTLDEYFKAKEEFLREELISPTFIYNHDPSPGHAVLTGPWLTDQKSWVFDRLKRSNITMITDLENISDFENSIVIVAGDHGPYISKPGRSLKHIDIDDIEKIDIQDRYGSFLAIKWPDNTYAEKYDIKILQDVMPAVYAYMYNDDSLFENLRMERSVIIPDIIGGVDVIDGIIVGGKYDGQELFSNNGVRIKDRE